MTLKIISFDTVFAIVILSSASDIVNSLPPAPNVNVPVAPRVVKFTAAAVVAPIVVLLIATPSIVPPLISAVVATKAAVVIDVAFDTVPKLAQVSPAAVQLPRI